MCYVCYFVLAGFPIYRDQSNGIFLVLVMVLWVLWVLWADFSTNNNSYVNYLRIDFRHCDNVELCTTIYMIKSTY